MLHGSGGEQRQAMARRGNRGQVEHEHRDPIRGRGEEDLDRVVPHRRRHVDIGIGMVQRVNAPQVWHCMLEPMDEIIQQIK